MIFRETSLKGLFIIDIEPLSDERGFFARSWCEKDFLSHGISFNNVQCNISFNKRQGTLRGMHFQKEPDAEQKIVRCTMGSIYDVVADIRPDSATYGRWEAFELNSGNRRMLYIPRGLAHGFQTTSDNTEVFYQMGNFFNPQSASGIRWNDPFFNIKWPLPVSCISEKDCNYPIFGEI
ncbi:MAG: dTDP-4-dehydrorhamnose 3,5-epimerase [Candidatus Riflebacteria bacterium]|nr:dTDP-4-dehydrorhamnose 3,5-epimerase [Candidatus Riflebacteria bacterium]